MAFYLKIPKADIIEIKMKYGDKEVIGGCTSLIPEDETDEQIKKTFGMLCLELYKSLMEEWRKDLIKPIEET